MCAVLVRSITSINTSIEILFTLIGNGGEAERENVIFDGDVVRFIGLLQLRLAPNQPIYALWGDTRPVWRYTCRVWYARGALPRVHIFTFCSSIVCSRNCR